MIKNLELNQKNWKLFLYLTTILRLKLKSGKEVSDLEFKKAFIADYILGQLPNDFFETDIEDNQKISDLVSKLTPEQVSKVIEKFKEFHKNSLLELSGGSRSRRTKVKKQLSAEEKLSYGVYVMTYVAEELFKLIIEMTRSSK